MSYVQEQQRKLFKEALENNNIISFKDFVAIVESCQVASGSNFGVGRIKGMLDFINQGHEIIIDNFKNEIGKKVLFKNKHELANAILSIDKFLDITKDNDFKRYF